jgi:hypothetical protein
MPCPTQTAPDERLTQQLPSSHTLPAQQGPPAAPHFLQTGTSASPLHVSVGKSHNGRSRQQGESVTPQRKQIGTPPSIKQLALGSVHRF